MNNNVLDFATKDILGLVHNAQVRAACAGVTITCFLMTPETEEMLISQIDDFRQVKETRATSRIGGIPFRVVRNLMECVRVSTCMGIQGETGWILNAEVCPDTGPAYQ